VESILLLSRLCCDVITDYCSDTHKAVGSLQRCQQSHNFAEFF